MGIVDRLTGLLTRVRALFGSSVAERELDEELRFHVEMETEAGIERGLEPAEARRRALVKFGGVERFKEEARDVRRLVWVEDLWRDVRLAVRSLRRNRSFAVASVLTLALGLAAVVAGFGLVYGILLRPLPYPEPDRLVRVSQTIPGWERFPASNPIFDRWSRETVTLESLAAYADARPWVGGAGGLERVDAVPATWTLPGVLGIAPRRGRWFTASEDRDGSRVVVVSDGFWRTRLGGAAHALGSEVLLDGVPHVLIGVMPPGFRFPDEGSALWLPLGPEARARGWNSQFLSVVGRLAPGATAAGADDDIGAITARAVAGGESPDVGARVAPLAGDVTAGVRETLLLAFGALAAVLLIAFLNVSNLFLARGTTLRRALAIRSALGASRLRLHQQRAVEALAVAFLGGLLGMLLAGVLLRLLAGHLPWQLPRLSTVSLDAPVLLFALAVTLAAGLLLGLFSSMGPMPRPKHLGAGGRHTGGSGGRWLRGALVGVEVAAVFALLMGAALLLRSLDQLLAEERGFDGLDVVVLVEPAPPEARYPDDAARGALFGRVVDRLREVPGVDGAALVLPLPFSGSEETTTLVVPGSEPFTGAVIEATADYFDILGIQLLGGRRFTGSEVEAAAPVALVNERLASRMGGTAVGRRLEVSGRVREVIGVVADVRHSGLASAPGPQVYIPFGGVATEALSVVARTPGSAGEAMPAIRAALEEVEPALAAERLTTLDRLVHASADAPRFRAALLMILAVTAALLAIVGIYGVAALAMAERTREMAIRVALGARSWRAAVSVVGRELGIVVAGLAAGWLAALALGRSLRGFLYRVEPTDPGSFAIAAAAVLLIVLGAMAVPAARTARINPIDTLNAE